MTTTPQKRALQRYRKRLSGRGMARFEVLGRSTDRELIRQIAKQLAGDEDASSRIRAALRDAVSHDQPNRGGILAALRRSPLVGADLDLERGSVPVRKVDL